MPLAFLLCSPPPPINDNNIKHYTREVTRIVLLVNYNNAVRDAHVHIDVLHSAFLSDQHEHPSKH